MEVNCHVILLKKYRKESFMAGNVSNQTYFLTSAQLSEIVKKYDAEKAKAIESAAIDGFNAQELTSLGTDIAAQIRSVGSLTNPTATTENIDKAKTIVLQSEIKDAQKKYNENIDKEAGLREDLSKAKSAFETSQEALLDAVSKMENAAANASETVGAEVNNIMFAAQNGQMDKKTAKEKLAAIGVPSLNGQKLALSGLTTEVDSLADKIANLSSVYSRVAAAVGDLATKYGSFLEVDIATICVDISGKIIINQPGSGGPATTGADGIAALDVAKIASMTTEDLAKSLEGEYKTLFDSINSTGTTALSSAEAAKVIKDLIASKSAVKGDASAFGTKGTGADVNILSGITKDELTAAATKAQEAQKPKSCDPYEIVIDGKTYQFVKDNGDGKFDPADLMGFQDQKNDIFKSMKDADINKDGKLTGDELEKQGVRLVQKSGGNLLVNDSSKDFDLSQVDSIDLQKLRASNQNDGNVGTFGNFDLKLKNGKVIEGKQTFEKLSTLQKLFKGVSDVVSNVTNFVKNKFQLDPETVEFYTQLDDFAKESSKLDKEQTLTSIDLVDETLDSSSDTISSALSRNVGKDEEDAKPKVASEPVETQTTQQTDTKKKKPEII